MRRIVLLLLIFVSAQQAMAFSSTNVNQKEWRWRKDDGFESNASWMAPKNSTATLNGIYPGQNLRLRMSFVTSNSGGTFTEGELSNYELPNTLEFATDLAGPWQAISTDSTAAFMLGYSSRVPAQLPVTEQLFSGGGAYQRGRMVDRSVDGWYIGFVQAFGATYSQENEWVLQATPHAQATTYYFRMSAAGQHDASVFPRLQVNPLTFAYDGTPFCAASGTVSARNEFPAGGTYSSSAGLAINAATGSIDLGASTPGRYTVTYTYDAGSSSTVLDIRPQTQGPAGFVAPGNVVACSGDFTGIAPFDAPQGLSYSWTNSNTLVGLGAGGNGPVPPFMAYNDDAQAAISQVNLQAKGGSGCNFKPLAYRITVKPAPSLQSLATYDNCAGQSFPASAEFNPAGTTYAWTNNNPAVGLPASGSGQVPGFEGRTATVFQNEIARVRVIATLGGCSVAGIRQYTVYTNATPIGYAQSNFCPSGRAELVQKPRATGGVFSADAGLSIDPATGTVNLSQSQPGTYNVYYTIPSGTCSNSSSTQITVEAGASVDPVPNQVYCNGMATNPIAFNGNATSYSWVNDNPAIGLAASGTGTSLPSFTTANAGPGVQYAYVKVTPQGTATAACPGKAMSFRFTVNYCGPVAGVGNTGDADARIALDREVVAGPNPTTGVVRVQYSGAAQQLDVLVRDAYGTVIQPVRRLASNNISIDLSSLRPGSYSVQFADPRTGAFVVRTIVKL